MATADWLGPLAGAGIALLGADLVSRRQARVAKDERDAGDRRRREEREAAAALRREDLSAAERRAAAEEAAAHATAENERRAAERQDRAVAATTFLARAETCFSAVLRANKGQYSATLPEGDWREVNHALARVLITSPGQLGAYARQVVDALVGASVDEPGAVSHARTLLDAFAEHARAERGGTAPPTTEA